MPFHLFILECKYLCIKGRKGISLTNYDFQEIALIDTGLTVRNKWNYEKAQDGPPFLFSVSSRIRTGRLP